jgi:hypothetical protein
MLTGGLGSLPPERNFCPVIEDAARGTSRDVLLLPVPSWLFDKSLFATGTVLVQAQEQLQLVSKHTF